ncbi:MAG: hypothetical protein IPL49_17145 [Saprospirales bacterium]|nr:hypothetical protein [Saprospirales bacterium]
MLGSASGLFNPGTILWTQVAGPAVIIDDPTNFVSSITGVIGGNMYTFRLQIKCTDGSLAFQDVTYTILPNTPANAGPDIGGCPANNPYTLAANSPASGELAFWSIVGDNNGVTIGSPTDPNTTITLADGAGGETTLRWTITNINGCFTTDDVIVTNCGGVEPVDAGANQNTGGCYSLSAFANMSATPAGYCGTGTWSVVSGPNVPTIGNVHDNNTTISNLIEGTYTFRWVVEGPCANGEDLVTIVVPPPLGDGTTAVASGSETFCDGRTSAFLTGNAPLYTNETVLWTQTGGPAALIACPTCPVTEVTGLDGTSTYSFSYTVTNTVTGCSSSDGPVTLQYGMNSIVEVAIENIHLGCDETEATITYTNSGPGAVQWRLINGPAGITTPWANADPSPFTITDLIVAGPYVVQLRKNAPVGASCVSASDQLLIIVSRVTGLSNAGTDQLFLGCDLFETDLAGNTPPVFPVDLGLYGTWSLISGPNTPIIDDVLDPNTHISGLIDGDYTFRWTISGGPICDPAIDDVVVRVTASVPPIDVDAGPPQTVCIGTPVYLSGNTVPSNELATWSVVPSAGVVFSDVNDPHVVVTGLSASTAYTFTWTVTNNCESASDEVVITTNNTLGPIEALAGPDQCLTSGSYNFNLAGNNPSPGAGMWFLMPGSPSSAIFSNSSLFNTGVTVSADGTYIFVWQVDNNACVPTTDTVVITISGPIPAANAGADQEVCGTSATMAAVAPSPVGTGTWTQVSGPNNAVITSPNSPTTTLTGLTEGVYEFKWTVENGACPGSEDKVKLFVSLPAPTAFAGNDQTICNATSTTLAGNAVTSGSWTVVSGPNTPVFSNDLSPTSTVSGLVFGVYVLQWNSRGGTFCPVETDQMQLTVYPAANAGGDQEYCDDISSVNLIGNVGSSGTWTPISGPNTATILSTSSIQPPPPG